MNIEQSLTPEEVEDIRQVGRDKLLTLSQLAKKYNVDVGHIRFIVNRDDK